MFHVLLICGCFVSEDMPTIPPPTHNSLVMATSPKSPSVRVRGGNPADVLTAQKKRFKVNAEVFPGQLLGGKTSGQFITTKPPRSPQMVV